MHSGPGVCKLTVDIVAGPRVTWYCLPYSVFVSLLLLVSVNVCYVHQSVFITVITLSEKLEYLFFSPRTFQCYFMNIHNKYFGKIFSALCVDVFTELFRIFPNFDISWYMTKYSEVHLKNCLLIHYWSISQILYSLDGLVDRVLLSYTGGPWITSREEPFFQYRDKTSEYFEIYREQLTSEHFLPYNYRSSTLYCVYLGISADFYDSAEWMFR
jgi:hypothetical protein